VSNALQDLMRERFAKLGLTQKSAARWAKANGLPVSIGTISYIHRGRHQGGMSDDTVAGLALLLRVPEETVRRAAKDTWQQAHEDGVVFPARFAPLVRDPEARRAAIAAMDMLLVQMKRTGRAQRAS